MSGENIAACLIVKNEEHTLERCLMSLRPYVDEVNVYDTGSTDGTLALLERLSFETTTTLAGEPTALATLHVVRGEWRGDFGWARAQSFAMASPDADWLLWTDADDEVEGGAELRDIVAALAPDVDAVVCVYDHAFDNEGQPRIRTWRERLVRANAGFAWRGVVHEHLAAPPGEHRQAWRADPHRLRWVHKPLDEWEPDRNLDLLQRKIERSDAMGETPDSHALFYLACEYFWLGDFEAAGPCLQRWLNLYGDAASDAALAAANKLAACHRVEGDVEAALRIELEIFDLRPDWLPTSVGLTQSYAAAKDWAKVIEWGGHAAGLEVPQTSVPVPYLELVVLPRLRLAEAELASGRPDRARSSFRSAAAAAPEAASLQRRLEEFERLLAEGAAREALRHVRSAAAGYDETMRSVLRGLTLGRSARA